eukprot:13315128-Ditylum_brightwellii.AAC.1
MERSKQNKHLVCDEDNDVDGDVDNGADNGDNDSVDNGDDDGVENGDDDSVDNGADSADKHHTHLSQAVDCCLMERSKQNKHL